MFLFSDVDRVYGSFFVSREYFVSVACFLTFNTCSVVGNILPNYITWVGPQTQHRQMKGSDELDGLGANADANQNCNKFFQILFYLDDNKVKFVSC